MSLNRLCNLSHVHTENDVVVTDTSLFLCTAWIRLLPISEASPLTKFRAIVFTSAEEGLRGSSDVPIPIGETCLVGPH